MIESIAFALFLKKVQIVFIAIGILFLSVISIYNLPWDGVEWKNLVNSIRKIKPLTFKTRWIDTATSATDIECTMQKVQKGH